LKIYKTEFLLSDVPSGGVYKCDTIEHEGRMWLVPDWISYPTKGTMQPIRIICLDLLQHQKTPWRTDGVDFVLNKAIPKAVLDGAKAVGYVVVENPSIEVPIPPVAH